MFSRCNPLAAAFAAFLSLTGAGAAPAPPAPVTFVATSASSWELSNGLVKTTFIGSGAQAYFVKLGGGDGGGGGGGGDGGGGDGGAWVQGAFAPAIEVAAKSFPETFPTSVKDRLSIPGLPSAYPNATPPTVYAAAGSGAGGAGGAVVPATNASFVLAGDAAANLTLSYALPLEGGMWAAEVSVSLAAGATRVREVIRFRRLRRAPAGAAHGDLVRVRKVFRSNVLPPRLRLSNWRSLQYFGWPVTREGGAAGGGENASFVVQTLGRWTPQSGGAAPVDMLNWSGNKVNIGPNHTVAIQAPPNHDANSPLLGFISLDDVPVGACYTLEHNVHVRPGYLFDREFLQHLWALAPRDKLVPRYSRRHTVDKMLFALQHTPGADGADGGAFIRYRNNATGHAFGFIAQAWYNYLGQVADPDTSPPSRNFTLLVQHSPDWGAGMDAWSAVFALLYRQRYGDADGFVGGAWALWRNGFAELPWNLEGTGTQMDGALWQAWDEQHGMHAAAFLGPAPIFWLCDSAKSSYFFLRMWELTGAEDGDVLFARATLAADFLLRLQLPSGDFAGSVFSVPQDGSTAAVVVRPPNFAASVSPILLWAKLYNITGNRTYLAAAERCADAVQRCYLQPGALALDGGELDDVMVNHHCDSAVSPNPAGLCVFSSSGGTYGVMALAELALVTRNASHVAMVRVVADWMLGHQWTKEINPGYYNSKARFKGMDFKTAGAQSGGMVRSEMTLFMLMAWRATGDPVYKASLDSYLAWATYTQYDDIYDPHFFGGGMEGTNVWFQYINGLGCNFFGETTGQGVGVLDYLSALEEDAAAAVAAAPVTTEM